MRLNKQFVCGVKVCPTTLITVALVIICRVRAVFRVWEIFKRPAQRVRKGLDGRKNGDIMVLKSYNIWLLALSISICLTAIPSLLAQGFIEAIEPLSGNAYNSTYGVSPDGNYVIASSYSNATGITRYFRWSVDQSVTIFGNLPGSTSSGWGRDVSMNGSYVVGTAENGAGNEEAFRWQASTGNLTGLGFLGTGDNSFGISISNDGQTLAGWSFNGIFIEGWYWKSAGGMQGIGELPGGEEGSAVNGISGDGNTVVGNSLVGNSPNYHAFKWSPGSNMQDLGVLGGYSISSAEGASYDGLVVIGMSFDTLSNTSQAFRWTSGEGMQGLGWLPGGQSSSSTHITEDGSTIFGRSTGTNNSGSFIWDDSLGMRDFVDYLQNEKNIDISGWLISEITDISADGKVIVGNGADPNGIWKGWRIKIPDISIIKPQSGDRWVINQRDTVRWKAPTVDFFSIDLSLDDGLSWQNLDFTTTPGDTMITYIVPESMITSSQCRIRVSDLTDSTRYTISEQFTIKGYDLTRIMPDSSLKIYDPDLHSWAIQNDSASMWPQAWWQQFDYAAGDDPNTNKRYPSTWPFVPVNAQSWQMPDWPLFVEAFSIDQCYWSVFFASYKRSAVDYWRSEKKSFGGSCYGFSVSSLLIFDYPEEFLVRNPGIAQADSINVLFLTDLIRTAINREWIKQYSHEVLLNDLIGKPKTPRNLLQEVKQLFLDETQDGKALSFFNNNGSGGHTVLPYRLERDADSTHQWRLYVYDSNNSNQFDRFIFIDSTANSWTDSTGNGWGTGNKRCYLEPSSNLFLQTLTLGDDASLESNPMMQLNTGIDNETLIQNAAGETIGYQDSSDFNTMSSGIAIIPKTGTFSPPIGYYLPENDYSVVLTEFQDTAAVFSESSGSQIYRYSRSDAAFQQTDQLYVGSGMQVVNPDVSIKNIELTAMAQLDSSERIMTASHIDFSTQDSLDFKVIASQQLKLANFGIAKTYNLHLSQSSSQNNSTFFSDNISLPANATHQVSPVWNDLTQPATIYIDLGNNGTIDDSIFVNNQTTGISSETLSLVPDKFKLYQNYPNPFNPSTTIRFELPANAQVDLRVYNLLGQEVAVLINNEELSSGVYNYSFNASHLSSGVYFYRIITKDFVQIKKMVLLR